MNMKVGMKLWVAILGIWVSCTILTARADRYVVEPGTPGGTNTGPFDGWGNAATQIQWAVDAASGGETVWVSNGVYELTNQIVITTQLA